MRLAAPAPTHEERIAMRLALSEHVRARPPDGGQRPVSAADDLNQLAIADERPSSVGAWTLQLRLQSTGSID